MATGVSEPNTPNVFSTKPTTRIRANANAEKPARMSIRLPKVCTHLVAPSLPPRPACGRAIAHVLPGLSPPRASWFETAPLAPPHHEGLRFGGERGPHPEGTPKAAVSKDGREKTAHRSSFSYAIPLPQAGIE